MTPVIHCPDHDLRRHLIHHPAKMSSDTGRDSALSLYNTTYKGSNISGGRRLRKAMLPQMLSNGAIDIKAKHEELLTTTPNEDPVVPTSENQTTASIACALCKSQCSPFFHCREHNKSTGEIEKEYLCHKCHWQAQPLLMSNGKSHSEQKVPAAVEVTTSASSQTAAETISESSVNQMLSTGSAVSLPTNGVDKNP